MTYFQSIVWIILAVFSAIASEGCAPTAVELPAEVVERSRYIRVPREFFERPVAARIEVGSSAAFEGGSIWVELPPTDPAPGSDALADFRNFPGCAGFPGESVRLCFDVIPDVSNLGVNEQELSAPGLKEWIAREEPGCADGGGTAAFDHGERPDDSSFSATFRVTCGDEPHFVKFTFRQA